MTENAAGIEVIDNASASRYEISIDGERAGLVEYEVAAGQRGGGDVITFTHTLTEPAMRGRGLAAIIVRQALNDARAKGQTVVPQCWYVAQFIDQHPAYADLLRAPGSES